MALYQWVDVLVAVVSTNSRAKGKRDLSSKLSGGISVRIERRIMHNILMHNTVQRESKCRE